LNKTHEKSVKPDEIAFYLFLFVFQRY